MNFMELNIFMDKLEVAPDKIEFADTMAVVDANYQFKETAFQNGEINNLQGENSGSCKLFSFAKKHALSEQQTLACFGAYYRNDVLLNPAGADHQNIRNFMKTGWQGVNFEGDALQASSSK